MSIATGITVMYVTVQTLELLLPVTITILTILAVFCHFLLALHCTLLALH